MKKFLSLIILFSLSVAVRVMAQSDVAMLIGYSSVSSIADDDEKAAAQWFQTTYPDGTIFTPSTIGNLSASNVKALWVHIDRVGIGAGWQNLPDAFKSTTTITALTNYVKAGGNLLLTGHATQLTVPLGRIDSKYSPNIFGSGNGIDNNDVWGVNANIGLNYDHRSHAIYKGMTVNSTIYQDHDFFPLIDVGWKEDHNCMWNLNNDYDLAESPNRVKVWEDLTNSVVIGTWQHVTDYCCAGIVEFNPTSTLAGTIIANGIAAYEWAQNSTTNTYLSNIQKLTKNSIDYLADAESVPVDPVVTDGQAVWFDMNLNGRYITELISNKQFSFEGVRSPDNVDGAAGKALRLDGYSNFVNVQIPVSTLSDKTLTVAMWVAPETYPMMVVDIAENVWTTIAGNISGNTGFAFTLSSQGDYGFDCYTGGWLSQIRVQTEKLPRGEWSHLVATIDCQNRKVTLYRNGQQVGQANTQTSINLGNASFLIGKGSQNVKDNMFHLNTFNGLIDDIEIFNKVLSATEIAAYKAQNAANLEVPESRFADDLLRPSFHGMPSANWTNETHGAVFYNNKFHVFFQKNGNGPYMSRLHWGHIYSDNMYKWHEDRIAVGPDNSYDAKGCWSGCVFTDNSYTGGKPWLIYTAVDNSRATIAQASPADDNLSTWNKLESNPIINGRPSGLSDDFRDPYFFTAGGQHYIIVGTSKDNIGATTLHRYNKSSRTWSNDGTIFFSGTNATRNGSFWEMPNVTDMGNGNWLFTCTPQNASEGVETMYWLGTINTDGKFSPTSSIVLNPQKLELDGMSKQGYGLLSPTIFPYDGKMLMLGIVPDKLPGSRNYEMGWAHTYSLPREISLSADGKSLVQKPYEGLKDMRTESKIEKSAFTLNGTQSLSPVGGNKFEAMGEFVIGTSDFGFNFYKNGSKTAKLYYSPTSRTINVDLTGMDRIVNDGGVFDGRYRSSLPQNITAGSTMKIHFFVDHSIMDVFVNDTWAFSVRLFPTDANATGLEAFANSATEVKSLSAWMLDENNGDPTGIEKITDTTQGTMHSLGYYDLSGKRIAKPTQKGIYINKVKTSEGIVAHKFIVR
ncbi:MAG: DUF4960 domain-containing protein [Prevotella sp.]|nr:DUF4960 domain-containing protein [Prevotella sp.]